MILREKTCYFTGHRSILTADRETIVGQMVDCSSICVCCWIRDKGGTAYTVHYVSRLSSLRNGWHAMPKHLQRTDRMEEKMLDSFEFETFIDIHNNIFMDYVSSIVAKLAKSDSNYQEIQGEISKIYEQYPKVAQVLDVEKTADLSEQDCETLIKILLLRNQLTDLEMQAVYLRGCCDCVGYLKKAGIL